MFARFFSRLSQSERQRQQQLAKIGLQAMRNAGYEASHLRVTDIGLLTYRTPNQPKIVRMTPVHTDTRYLRPFVEMSGSQRGETLVSLELFDDHDKPYFVGEIRARLAGKTRLVPQTWLPLADLEAPIGRWWIVVRVNGMVMAAHPFTWVALHDNDILNQLRNDGEINDELRQAVRAGKFRPMSLDELLADQEE